jgi:hypothetical protein
LRLRDLKQPFLQAGFNRQTNRVVSEIRKLKETSSVKQYELDLTLAFWFAIHLEDL